MKTFKAFLAVFLFSFFIAGCEKELEPYIENNPPTVNAGSDVTIDLTTAASDSIRLTGTAADADGTVVGYMWSQVSGPSKSNIITPGSASTYVDGLVSGSYEFQLMATDNKGAVGVKSVKVTIIQKAIYTSNLPPYANAGNDTTVTLSSATADSVRLTGSAMDVDGVVVSYLWSQIAGPNAATIKTPGSASTSIGGLVSGQYMFQLMATDDKGAVGSKSVSVRVISNYTPAGPNVLPIVSAGNDTTFRLVSPENEISLRGSAVDPDGRVVGYTWTQVSGPNTAKILYPGSATTSVSGVIAGQYVFQLMATDDKGATCFKSVVITVQVVPPTTQTVTINLQPAANTNEGYIHSLRPWESMHATSNEFSISAWTNGGSDQMIRGLVKFDLSSVPAGARITSAKLSLYSTPAPTNSGNLVDANFGTNNTLLIQRVTSVWNSSVTWDTQPAVDAATQVVIPHTNLSMLDLVDVDVTSLVNSMVQSGNYGFMLRLQNEVIYTSRNLCTSKHANAAKRPRLVVQYAN